MPLNDDQEKEGITWNAAMTSDTSNLGGIGASSGYWPNDTYASTADGLAIPVTRSESLIGGDAYIAYPPTQPFVHDDYRRDPCRPITAYPESNRQGQF